MYLQCDISNITSRQVAELVALQTLFSEQSLKFVVKSIDPIVLDIKSTMAGQMRERLLRDRVGAVLHGYKGKIEGNSLTVYQDVAEAEAEEVNEPDTKPKVASKRGVPADEGEMAGEVA